MYWQPVHAVLEGAFTVVVGNASHMRNVPGRKTDVKDAEWIADLVRHGLVRASFVPPPEIRMLRELVRHRKALAGTLAAERNRTLQLLESAGIKLAGVMSDVFGVSGMLMLRALAGGTADAATMADLAKRRLHASPRHWPSWQHRPQKSCMKIARTPGRRHQPAISITALLGPAQIPGTDSKN